MFIINKEKNIRIVQGDTACMTITLTNYELQAGDEIHFAVIDRLIIIDKEDITMSVREKYKSIEDTRSIKTTDILIQKCYKEFTDGKCIITLASDDTKNIKPGTYSYDIQVKTRDGRVDTFVPAKEFKVLEGISNAIIC